MLSGWPMALLNRDPVPAVEFAQVVASVLYVTTDTMFAPPNRMSSPNPVFEHVMLNVL